MYNRRKDTQHPPTPQYEYASLRQDAGYCTAVLGTMTNALQAQRVLGNAAIHATVTKISSSKSAKGCAYGINYPCMQEDHVRDILARAGVTVKKYMGG